MIQRLWLDFRYERPIAFRVAMLLVLFTVAASLFLALPDTPITRATGVVSAQQRFHAFRRALYWQTRAYVHPDVPMTPVVIYGFVDAVDQDGLVSISAPSGKEFIHQKFRLADIKTRNLYSIAKFLADHQREGIRVDAYGDMAVLLLEGVPLNVMFIELGYAEPDPVPPTNIVDQAFAAHYWRLVKNGGSTVSTSPAATPGATIQK